ncbi:MAG: hypothetical protein CMO55_15315 [Verrucomicrobiales bacterium]|nr:hypothetical protein [Verrucomicrobiales bacterium]
MSLVLNYAAVGFRPYPEIGEFVNVGLVAVEARSRFLVHKLISSQKTKRISACFPELDLSVYRQGLKRLDNELSALAIETNLWADDSTASGRNHPSQDDLFVVEGDMELFRRLTAPISSPFFYASKGTFLTDDIEMALDRLYRRYVEHWNLNPVDYEEKKLTRDLRKLLHANRLDKLYREAPWVGTDAYHVGIPLAFTPRGSDIPEKAIKPLNLDQATPTRIYTHGDEWVAKVRRLQRVDCLPGEFLFVVKRPKESEERDAADEICEALVGLGVQVVDVDDEEAIIEFAQIEEQRELKLTN